MTWTQKKIPAQWWLQPQATCSLGTCHGELHTNRDRNFLCVLPYLNISDSLWLKVYSPLHYPNRDLQGGWQDIYHGSSFLSKTFPKLTSVVAYLSDYTVTERDCYYEHVVMDQLSLSIILIISHPLIYFAWRLIFL